MLVMGGSAALLSFWMHLAIILGFLSIVLGWSRHYLARHTLAKLILGWLVGGVDLGCG